MLDACSSREIELKLELTPEGAEALLASDMLSGECDDVALHAVYFDTPDRRLHAEGLTLRIRQEDGDAVQTVKAGESSAGLFSRGEWELPAFGRDPVPDERTPVPALLGAHFADLTPLFEVPVQRRRCRIEADGATIDLALDRGEALSGERRAPFCELELELVDGPNAALFALARRVDAVAPVRIGVLTKAERGYRLLGEAPQAVRAEKLQLDPGADLASAFAQIAGACLRHYRLNEAILLDQPVPEAVHQARVALRRLRSAMTLFKGVLTGPKRKDLSARLRALAAVLGEARDLDVLAEKAQGPVLDKIQAARAKAYATLTRRLSRPKTRLLPLDLAEWIEGGGWRSDPDTARLRETPLREFAAAALDRLRRRTRKHGKHLAKIDPEDRHRLRKDAKKLRYAVEFLAPLFAEEGEKKRRKAFLKTLEAFQDDLGALNDHQTARDRVAKLGLEGTAEAKQLLSGWDTKALLRDAARGRRALLDRDPFWQ